MVTAVVHIGFTKTGSTTVQRFLSETRGYLRGRGIAYPQSLTISGQQHIALSMICMRLNPERPFGPRLIHDVNCNDHIRLLEAECHDSLFRELDALKCDTVVFSDEGLSGLTSLEEVEHLKRFLAGVGFDHVRILAYLRRPDSHYRSDVSQRIASGYYVDGTALYYPHLQHDIHWFYEYHDNLSHWADAFGIQNLIVRVYEDYFKSPNGVLEDFLAFIGVLDLFAPIEMGRLNVSVGGDVVVVLNQVNRVLLAQRRTGYGDLFAFCREALSQLDEARRSGPRFQISGEAAQTFNALFESSLHRLRLDFFPDRGKLFPDVEDLPSTHIDFASQPVRELMDLLLANSALRTRYDGPVPLVLLEQSAVTQANADPPGPARWVA